MTRRIVWSLLGLAVGYVIGAKSVYQDLTLDFYAYCFGGLVIGFLISLLMEKAGKRKGSLPK